MSDQPAVEEQVTIQEEEGGFIYWPEIVGLHIVRKTLEKYPHKIPQSVLTYKGKIKLHGNNGGINITGSDGCYNVQAQSRNRVLTPTSDLDGFAKWTEAHKDAFIHVRKTLKEAFPATEKTVVFGEWCGQGIQSKVSLCKIGRKIFAVFSLLVDDGLISDPAVIAKFFPPQLPENCHIIPWMTSAECGEAMGLDFNKVDHLEAQVVKINSLIGRIDNSDPWVLETFKVDGPGEGVVWYPVTLQTEDITILHKEHFADFAFKAKGAKHAVVQQDKPVQLKPQVAAGVPEFVAMFVTEGRGEQGLSKVCENGEKPTKAHTPKFIQWIVADVQKESATELEASGLTWKQVEKEVGNAARKWFLAHVN